MLRNPLAVIEEVLISYFLARMDQDNKFFLCDSNRSNEFL